MLRPILSAFNAFVRPQFQYGVEVLFMGGKSNWNLEEGKCVKQLLALTSSTMLQAVRVECHLAAWNFRGMQATFNFWQRMNGEGHPKVAYLCK